MSNIKNPNNSAPSNISVILIITLISTQLLLMSVYSYPQTTHHLSRQIVLRNGNQRTSRGFQLQNAKLSTARGFGKRNLGEELFGGGISSVDGGMSSDEVNYFNQEKGMGGVREAGRNLDNNSNAGVSYSYSSGSGDTINQKLPPPRIFLQSYLMDEMQQKNNNNIMDKYYGGANRDSLMEQQQQQGLGMMTRHNYG